MSNCVGIVVMKGVMIATIDCFHFVKISAKRFSEYYQIHRDQFLEKQGIYYQINTDTITDLKKQKYILQEVEICDLRNQINTLSEKKKFKNQDLNYTSISYNYFCVCTRDILTII